MIKKNIPNYITLLNLLSGCIGVVLAMQNNLLMAAVFVGLGIFFDFFDGLAARLLNVQSELGLQLDSLADMVTSGVVPGIVMMQLINRSLNMNRLDEATQVWAAADVFEFNIPLVSLLGFLITLGSAYRLAKFNIDDRQTSSFIGLPTPANAILILSLPLILLFEPNSFLVDWIQNPWVLIGLTVFSTLMLNAELPLFALKFKTWGFAENWFRYLFLLVTVLLLLLFTVEALPLIIIGYIILSVFVQKQID